MQQAFDEGYNRFEWLHQTLTGELIPSEITLIRTEHNGESVLAGYMRDLRDSLASQNKLREADERVRIMLDATPLCCSLVDRNGRILDCNQEAANLFGLSSKQEYIDHFKELEDKYQPDGSPSYELGLVYIEQAFREGYCRFEWTHRKLNGDYIPAEIILVRVKYRGQDIVAGYTRDLREQKAMLDEMRKVENDLRLARDAAEESTLAKSEFLANMSHEIRTPMNGILGLLHLVLKTELTAKQREYLDKTEQSARALLRILNDILDFSKIEAGKLDMEAYEFDLQTILGELQDIFGHSIKAKKLDFNVSYPQDLPDMLVGDSLRLKQVLLNIVSNAIKFTQRGGISINIDALRRNRNYCLLKFVVKDTGIGMTSEQLRSLFSAFSQGDASITRRYGGTGLGLAICKNLVHMMHGTMWVDSEYGKGSTFSFTVRLDLTPLKKYRLEDDAKNAGLADMLSESADSAAPEIHPTKTGRILLAEDNEINQLIASNLIESFGYSLDIASNGQEAMEMLVKENYALVLLDIQMPVMDGLTTARAIRALPEYQALPIIAMSAHAMDGDYEKSLDAGMNEHLTKPIDPDILGETLQRWLSGQSAS